jgi:pimeloyl-ACP methyl ester carboxylesterase
MKVVFVHGACVRDGAWWWRRMVTPLTALGRTTEAVELPSCGPEQGDLYADGDAVRAVLDRADEPVILCGHSYGGHVITDVAGHPAIERMVYIATVMPNPDRPRSPWLQVRDGTIGVDPAIPGDLMFHDCPDVFEEALKRTARQSLGAFAQRPRGVVALPTTYVVCTEDRWTPPEWQRETAKDATRIVEVPAGHHPFISQPSALAAVL